MSVGLPHCIHDTMIDPSPLMAAAVSHSNYPTAPRKYTNKEEVGLFTFLATQGENK